ncbi:hypothetical protein [Paenibacillus sp. Soil766]|uniref:hypothetical protein n=1 Tax=Paenibacillus sp. Soil766 TaxID=1736404 RepID=UPI000B088C32|nr:hypothetical protein [Paenibacillus sp. Soil766]
MGLLLHNQPYDYDLKPARYCYGLYIIEGNNFEETVMEFSYNYWWLNYRETLAQ